MARYELPREARKRAIIPRLSYLAYHTSLSYVWYVVQVCFEGCYVCENVVKGSVEPCLVEFSVKNFGGVCKNASI